MASAKPKKKSDEPGVFDVSKPGKSTPSATSRPIIVTNRPMLQDPMMAAEGEPVAGTAPPVNSKITIKPITVTSSDDTTSEEAINVDVASTKNGEPESSEDSAEPPAAPEETAADVEPDTKTAAKNTKEKAAVKAAQEPAKAVVSDTPADTDVPEATEQPVQAEPEPQTTATEPADTEAKPADETQDGIPGDDATKSALTPEEQDAEAQKAKEAADAHALAIEKLVDSEQYFLPINTVESRKTRRIVVLGVLLIAILGAIWVDVALDAGLIKLGSLKPVTHFFSQPAGTATTPTTPATTSIKSFTTNATGVTFNYLSSWILSSQGSDIKKDVVALKPSAANDTATISVAFLSQPSINQSGTFTAKSVHYQKLSHQISGNTYLRDLVYADQQGHINLVSSLGNTTGVVNGQRLHSVDQTFLNPDGTTTSLFSVVAFRSIGSNTGFATVNDAEQFLRSSQYQQARDILLSAIAAKQ